MRSNWTAYFAPDHLGSAESEFLQPDGFPPIQVPFARYSNSVFGERRDIDWDGAPLSNDMAWINSSNRGFTDHEHLDNLGGLIHMNGRVYDARIGRFISADPFVQFPFSGQGLNRYSYTHNNPLRYTDPSGFQNAGRGRTGIDAGFGLAWFPAGDWVWTSGSAAPLSIDESEYARAAIPSWVPVTTSSNSGVTPTVTTSIPRVRPAPDPTLPPADGSLAGVGNSAAGMAMASTVGSRAGAVAGAATAGELVADGAVSASWWARIAAFFRGSIWTVPLTFCGDTGNLCAQSSTAGPPAAGPLNVGGATTPGDPNQFDPDRNRDKLRDGPQFDDLRDHARRHSNLSPNAYYNQAVRHTQVGQRVGFYHNGQFKYAYITRTGADSFRFTSGNTSGTRIFTHIDGVTT